MQISNAINPAAIQNVASKAVETPAATPVPVTTAQAEGRSRDDLATLQVAQEAVRQAAPDFDVARVAEIKAAMQRGEIRFEADKLAGLILSIHGGQR